ncbi:MAG: SulP family inorganic anion transporter [Gammaproteobacteria bacterium]|nr:SulP family inorganic anion transporter [Gammaproteobacteria bacterium]MCP5423476.1 SulP family inorganic anion transporter [Gammaproteobacteria bacterium]MCP5458767.1 SulP family inorganic anion transporter [Gammaproteobacteria bacterium]
MYQFPRISLGALIAASANIRRLSRIRLPPKFFPFMVWGRQLTPKVIRDDFWAGLTGAIIALPQGVAFALIAGLPPQYGLYTAIVVPIIAGLFGSSRHMVSGPATAISMVVFSVVGQLAPPGDPHYLPYVLTLTFLTGLFQLLLGMARMGVLVNFISHTVVVGFTTGAAVLIVASQIKHFLGLTVESHSAFLPTVLSVIGHLFDTNLLVVAIATMTLLTCQLVGKYRPRWPRMLIGILAGSLLCWYLDGQNNGVALLGSLPASLPPPSLPDFSINTVRQLAPGALAVAMLGLIEAVSIARSVAARSHQRIDGNQEFIGQGLSNFFGSFFSCYAGSGSFTRSGVNYDAGAKTPLSSIFAALFVALALVFFAPLAAYLPMPTMAAVIMLGAWNLVEGKHIRMIVRTSRRETMVLISTFLATLFIALEFAIYAGVLLSLIMYLQRTSHPRVVSLAPDSSKPKRQLGEAVRRHLPECPQLKTVRLEGSLFFGAVNHVQDALHRFAEQNSEWKHVLIICTSVNFIDVAGAEMLAQEAGRLRAKGGGLYLSNLKSTVRTVLERGGYANLIGEDHLFTSKEQAIGVIFQRLDLDRCSLCARRVFRECATVKFEGSGLIN